MINVKQTDLLGMTRNELVEVTKRELEEYKEVRIYNQVHQNIPIIKTLESLDKRLGAFALGDEEVISIRAEVKDLLNEDVYKKTTPPKATTNFSSYEDYINARLRSK